LGKCDAQLQGYAYALDPVTLPLPNDAGRSGLELTPEINESGDRGASVDCGYVATGLKGLHLL